MATDWNRLTVVDLRQELKRRNLSATGKKAELVARLTDAEIEQDAAEQDAAENTPQPDDENVEIHDAPPVEVPLEQRDSFTSQSQPENPPVTTEKSPAPGLEAESNPEIRHDTEEAPSLTNQIENDPTTTQPMIAEPSLDEKTVNPVPEELESTAPELSPDLSRDVRGRKRRSRTPPPSDDESSRKRQRAGEQDEPHGKHDFNGAVLSQEELLPLDNELAGKDISYAILCPEIPTEPRQQNGNEGVIKDEDRVTKEEGKVVGDVDTVMKEEETEPADDKEDNREQPPAEDAMPIDDDHSRQTQRQPEVQPRTSNMATDFMDEDNEDGRDVAPAVHPATSALYIKNLMRPLKEVDLRDHLVDVATPRRKTPNHDVVVDFYLDPIRTHAFIIFSNVTSASRARVSLHGKIWPNERGRKELWVDFIPPEKFDEWVKTEDSETSRGTRWEVRYAEEEDADGGRTVTTELVNAADFKLPSQSSTRNIQPLAGPIPTGPARRFPGIEGAPLGPRGRGSNQFQDFRSNGPMDGNGGLGGGDFRMTESLPNLPYKPVSLEVADRRLEDMRSYYTKDRRRSMGRPDEINRYTFENMDQFVDRGVEVFIGIRPPRREQERRQGGGRDWPRRGGGPPLPPFNPRGDRYLGGGYSGGNGGAGGGGWDGPRSRLDGAPLPTFGGGGGGFRSGRRGPRRDGNRSGRW